MSTLEIIALILFLIVMLILLGGVAYLAIKMIVSLFAEVMFIFGLDDSKKNNKKK